ncbi:hypothetical protein NKDENANG_01059 [Candidatus Entotheonellaceae bacterium PAL068K]
MLDSVLLGCVTVGIHMILAISVNIISGYARQLSLGQAAFAALGAYTSALFNLRFGLSFWIACPLSLVLTAGVGLLLGLPGLCMPRYYLMVMTLGLNALVQHLLRHGRFVGGYFGLGHITAPRFFNLVLDSSAYLPLVLVALGVCIVADRWFWHSRFGQVLRQGETEERVPGAPATTRAVLVAFVMSTAMAGLAGSLFAHFEAFISPVDFNFEASLFVLALAACGGLGSLGGAMLGALVVGLLECVRPLVVYRQLISGLILLLVGAWLPRGLLSLPGFWVGKRRASVSAQPEGHAVASDSAAPRR